LLQSLIAGDVQVACVPFATTLPHIQAGTLRALAVTTAQRVAVLSDVPTVAESGFPGFESSSWQGWFVPAGTPREVVIKLNSYGRKALEAPDVIEKLKSFGNVSVGSSPEEFDAFFKADVAKFAKVVKEANIPRQD
jgi:tripartite-type tricarboxylate transporter receptor subunit TctC